MSLGGRGPRDWSPPESISAPPPRRRPATPTTGLLAARPRSRRAEGTFALLLGLGSLAIAVLEPQTNGVATGFVASSIGITAMVLGVRAVRSARWGSASVRAFGRGGVILGAVGTALMVYAIVASALLPNGIALPALSLRLPTAAEASTIVLPSAATDRPHATTAPAPESARSADPAQAAAVPAVPAVTTRDQEQAALVQSAGTLAFVMKQTYGAGLFPETISVIRSSTDRVEVATGAPAVGIPAGATVQYATSPDRSAWRVTIVGARFGATATFDSSVGTVEAS